MEYNVDYFIEKFSNIPDSKWITANFGYKGMHCAAGHCGATEKGPTWDNDFDGELLGIVKVFLSLNVTLKDSITPYGNNDSSLYFRILWNTITAINDNHTNEYQQSTPKERILAALYDIKKMQQPEIKEKKVYVAVPESISQEARQRILEADITN